VRGVLVGAGDIARCRSGADDSTGRLLKDIVEIYRRRGVPVLIFTAGDNAYPLGRRVDYRTCYDPAWGGPLKDITRPSPGNHDFEPRDDGGYFEYFGKAAGDPDRGYYEYELAGWNIFSLNSDVLQPGVGMTRQIREPVAAAQSAWLNLRLKEPTSECSIAYWHHPRWSSGPHGNNPHVDTLWRLLYSAGAEIVINGHDHLYERFKPLDPDSTVDEADGLVEFVVGTGGGALRRFPGGRNPGISKKQVEGSYGVLVLELEARQAHYRFIATTGETLDQGEIECHGRPEQRSPSTSPAGAPPSPSPR
jgi:acid phosphatase type 7